MKEKLEILLQKAFDAKCYHELEQIKKEYKDLVNN